MDLFSPADITAKAVEIWEKKAHAKMWDTFVSGILAWCYIALGAMFSITSISWLQNLPFGIVKVIAWLAFSLGLILVMVAWAELFTGNALLIISLFKRKITVYEFLRNLFLVYISNFVWALIIVGLLFVAKWYTLSGWIVGTTLANIGIHKLQYGFFQAFSLGILCNILVCLGVWLWYSGRSTTDKVFGIIFPVTAFVAAGFEHSVANMFYLPFTYLFKIFGFWAWTLDFSGVTLYTVFVKNLLPVTLGNIVGWAVFVGISYRYLYLRDTK